MSFCPVPDVFGAPRRDPELEPALLVRITEQALRLNDKLLAERAPRGKTRRRKR